MSAHHPYDIVESGWVGKVFRHFAIPAQPVSSDPVLESVGERAGIEVLRLSLPFEQPTHLRERHLHVIHEPVEIVDVSALNALDDASELLGGDLLDRVDVERNWVGQI